MMVEVSLPDELIAQIDAVTDDRAAFIAKAVIRVLRWNAGRGKPENDKGDDDVPEFQTNT